MIKVFYRIACEHDVDAIVKLVELAYRTKKSRAAWTTEADILGGQRTDQAEIQALIQQRNSRIVLAILDNTIIASIHIKHQHRAGVLGLFAVEPDYQNQGIGSQLLHYAERYIAEDLQCNTVIMHVISIRSELIAWYQRQGYRGSKIYSDFPYNNIRFGIPKVSKLQFEELHKTLKP